MATSPQFESWNSFWGFSHAVRHRLRFLHDKSVTKFLEAVAGSAKSRLSTVSMGKALWRAQTGHDWEQRFAMGDVPYNEPTPFTPARMKPLRNSAYEGRVNPRGIPCLYAASDKETSVAEVRPWLGALVSVAQLGLVRELRVVNCCDGHEKRFELYLEEPTPEVRERAVWRAIGQAFSEPVSADPGIAEYVPTQVLAEHFRKLGFDGVVYKSRLGAGLNFAMFDLDVLKVVDVRLYPVKAVRYEIGELQNSYVVTHKRRDA